jgi:hypothetical protein
MSLATRVLSEVAVALPAGWLVTDDGVPAGAGTLTVSATDREGLEPPPALLSVAVNADDPAPPPALLSALVADLFVNAAVQYSPVGDIEDVEVAGFDAAAVARGDLTLNELGGRPLPAPTRYRLEQWILAGPGAHRVHMQLAQPLDRYDAGLCVSVLAGVHPVDAAEEGQA